MSTDNKNLEFDFEFGLEDLQFILKITQNPHHIPDHKYRPMTRKDEKMWREGSYSFYQVMITSTDGDQELTHYIPAILLPNDDEEELQKRMEEFLDGPDGLDKLLPHWDEDPEADQGPLWRL